MASMMAPSLWVMGSTCRGEGRKGKGRGEGAREGKRDVNKLNESQQL